MGVSGSEKSSKVVHCCFPSQTQPPQGILNLCLATTVTCQGLPGTLKLSLDSCDCLFGLRDPSGYLSVLLLQLFGTSVCTPHERGLSTYPCFLISYTLVKSPTVNFYLGAIFSDQRLCFGHDINCFQV